MAHTAQDTRTGADSQAFCNLCLKPNLLTAHLLAKLIYGDNTCPPCFGNDNSKTIFTVTFSFRCQLKYTTSTAEDVTSL